MPPTSTTTPKPRFSCRMSSRTAAIGAAWVAHVLQCDDVAVLHMGVDRIFDRCDLVARQFPRSSDGLATQLPALRPAA